MQHAPKGFILHDVAGTEEDGSPKYFTRKENGTVAIDLEGPVYIEIPESAEALEQVFGDYTTTFRTPNGVAKYEGPQAAAMRKATHDFESAVSSLKTRLRKGEEMSEEAIRESLRTWWTGTSSKPALERSRIEEINEIEDPAERAEAMEAFLASKGLTVS